MSDYEDSIDARNVSFDVRKLIKPSGLSEERVTRSRESVNLREDFSSHYRRDYAVDYYVNAKSHWQHEWWSMARFLSHKPTLLRITQNTCKPTICSSKDITDFDNLKDRATYKPSVAMNKLIQFVIESIEEDTEDQINSILVALCRNLMKSGAITDLNASLIEEDLDPNKLWILVSLQEIGDRISDMILARSTKIKVRSDTVRRYQISDREICREFGINQWKMTTGQDALKKLLKDLPNSDRG